MTQNPVPAAEIPDTTAGEGEETIGKSAVIPGADSRDEATSPAKNRKEPLGTAAPDEGTGVTEPGPAAEDMDLSPRGLKDAPAQEEDEDSLVDPGNS